MSNKTILIFTVILLVIVSFAFGYQLGMSKTLDNFSDLRLETNSTTANNQQTHKRIDEHKNNPLPDTTQIAPTATNISALNKKENIQQLITSVSGQSISSESSVIEMLNFLLALSKSTENEDMKQFGPTMDIIHQAIEDDPSRMDDLLEYFIEAGEDSRAPYYITTLIQGSSIPDKTVIISNLITQLTALGDKSANSKLLHLVSSTGAHYDNPDVLHSIKNIALYTQNQDNNRIYALDLLMPFQLNQQEKNILVSDFTFALEQVPSEEKSMLLENIIRFSDKQSRKALAADYLSSQHEFSTRIAVLSTLHSGSVAPSNELKQQLFSIAEDSNDPLSEHAKNALIYAFEINNKEYKRLKNTD